MTRRRTGSVAWVHLVQALAAREGVEALGLSARRVASLLGVAPSAVSQYLSGQRVEQGFVAYATNERARAIARRTIEQLIEAVENGHEATRVVLEGAASLAELPVERDPRSDLPVGTRDRVPSAELRALARWLRRRVKAEQVAVAQCMRLAQRARDELTRSILRQIASDSLRHAEIVASLAPYIDRGVANAFASGVTRREIEGLIESERRAESQADTPATRPLQGTMAILIASMEADERKHAELLRSLLATGFRDEAGPAGALPRGRSVTTGAGRR